MLDAIIYFLGLLTLLLLVVAGGLAIWFLVDLRRSS